jgi:hypothetical protein
VSRLTPAGGFCGALRRLRPLELWNIVYQP